MTESTQNILNQLKGMKEAELQKLGPCVMCGKPQLGSDITFYCIEVTRAGFDRRAIERRVGLQIMLGGAGALAAVMGPDEDLAKVIDGPHRVFVHETCAGMVSHLVQLIPDEVSKPFTDEGGAI